MRPGRSESLRASGAPSLLEDETEDVAVRFRDFTLSQEFLTSLRDVDLALRSGESVAVVGPAGSGKLLLLRVLALMMWDAGLEIPRFECSGSLSVLGHPVMPQRPPADVLRSLRAKIAFLGERSAWLPLSISENFAMAQSLQGMTQPQKFQQLVDALPTSARNKALLSAQAELAPAEVEPPILQQLALLRALLAKPKVLLLDEPFARMDPVLLRHTETLAREMAGDALVLWATNDLHQASRVTDSVVFLYYGKVLEHTPTARFFTNPATREAELFIAGREDGE